MYGQGKEIKTEWLIFDFSLDNDTILLQKLAVIHETTLNPLGISLVSVIKSVVSSGLVHIY